MGRKMAAKLILLACSFILVPQSSSADCRVNVNFLEFPSTQPLLLMESDQTDASSFLAPDSRGDIVVSSGTQLLVACPGSRFKLMDVQSQRATCVSGTVFSVDTIAYTLNLLACTSLPKAIANITSTPCGNATSHKMVEIGFTVGEGFYKLYEVCFDTEELTPLYTSATIIAGIKGFQVSFPGPKQWQDGDLYGSVNMNNQYKTLRDTLVNQLGVLPDNLSRNSLTRGHLAAKADFGLGVQQTASFFYPNSAPQWYAFNSGNWNQLELDVRDFASANYFDLQVHTGTYGKLKLEDKTGNLTEIYLYASKSQKKVPVPMLFWKIVYEPKSKQAMVFVGVNNPYYSFNNLPSEYKLCADVCSRVNWLHWKPTNQTAGIAYCCEYSQFKAKVSYAPQLDVTGTFSSSGAEATSATVLVTIICSVWLSARAAVL